MNAILTVELIAILARVERGEADQKDARQLRAIYQAQAAEIERLKSEVIHLSPGAGVTAPMELEA